VPAPDVPVDRPQIRVAAAQPPPSMEVTAADRRLPVPVERPGSRGSWQPLVLVALLVAGIAIAAAVVVATLPRGGGAPKAAASAAASTPAVQAPTQSAAPPSVPQHSAPQQSASAGARPGAGAPPQRVRLQDNRDSVSLTWIYPKAAEGPVLISGGRAGQEQRAFQQLPAGTTNYVVYGLNEQTDYCFTVAVVYSVDHVAASRPLCTNRR
jgi:hypothetical protein